MIKIVGGKYKGSNLNVPLGNKVRPTSIGKRKIIFDILTSFFLKQDNIENYNNKIILDGFSGSGAMGIEALSRGASFCYFFDYHAEGDITPSGCPQGRCPPRVPVRRRALRARSA